MMRPLFLAALTALGASSAAATHPAHPVTIVVPFAPGGGADFVAQRLAEALPATLGEPVSIAHRPGQDGLVAVDEVAAAPTDGTTLLLGSAASLVFAPLAHGRMPLDPREDFEPVAMVASVARMVLAHPSLEVKNLDQLIRLAREQPGRLSCGTSDQLSQHAARLFERQAGVKLDCVAYPGGAALREDLVSGRRKVAFESAFLPEVQAGRLVALAVASTSRTRALPDVPTASESGLPGFEAVAWTALLAPKRTPRARVEALAAATQALMKQPSFIAALEARGFAVRPMTHLQMREYLQRDMTLWRRTT